MNLIINLTDNCNLDCDYCYYKNNNRSDTADHVLIDKIFDFFTEKGRASADKGISITLFGGEPLLEKDLIEHVVSLVKSDKYSDFAFRLAVNTNGTMLDEQSLKLFRDNSFRVFISLDGPPEVHDLHRRTHGGKSSHKLIYPWLDKLDGVDVFICKVITTKTLKDTFRSISYLVDLGFRNIILSLDFTDEWQPSHFKVLKKEYEKTAKLYYEQLKAGDKVYISLLEDKIQTARYDISLKETCCSSGKKVFTVSPAGDIYPCTHFVDYRPDNPYLIGNIHDGIDQERIKELDRFHLEDKKECSGCDIARRCLGNCCGCVSFYTTGSVFDVSPVVCEHERMLTEISDKLAQKIRKEKLQS